MAEAAYIGAEAVGEMSSTSQLLEGSWRVPRKEADALHYVSAATFVMLNGDGHVDTAHRPLVGAIEGGTHRYDAGNTALIHALWTLALVCFCGGRRELWAPFYAALARLSPESPAESALTVDMFADPARTGVAALPRLEAALRTVHHGVDPSSIDNIAAATMYADRLPEVREPLWRSVLRGREGTSGRRHLVALMDLCVDDFHRGEWREAAELAAEGLESAKSAEAGSSAGTSGLAASGMTNKQIAERLYLSPPDSQRSPVPDLPQAGHHDASRPPRCSRPGGRLLASRPLRRCFQVGNPLVEGSLRGSGIRFPQCDGRLPLSRRKARQNP